MRIKAIPANPFTDGFARTADQGSLLSPKHGRASRSSWQADLTIRPFLRRRSKRIAAALSRGYTPAASGSNFPRCRIKARWVELVEHADLPEEEKWLIFTMLIGGDARLEEVPGLGLKVTLPP